MFINLPLEITSYPLRFIEKHYILLFIITKIEITSCCCLVAQSCLTFCDPHGLQHTRHPCPSLSSRICSNSMIWWCHPTISSSVIPFSCPQSFPTSGTFPMSWLFTSGGHIQSKSCVNSSWFLFIYITFLKIWPIHKSFPCSKLYVEVI